MKTQHLAVIIFSAFTSAWLAAAADDATNAPTIRATKVETLTPLGFSIYHGVATAYFEGTDIRYPKFFDEGASISDLKIVKVTPKTVTLTNASSNTFVLPTDGSASLRREDNGPWHLTGSIAATPASGAHSTATSSSASASAAGADDILARLRKKREQESQ